ncbi:MAG: aminomethyl-transferring glycine dehydrogenase [Bacteroidetes bacterium]|nr:aminomethyl-transferring glycine dehydrogenase [Bacteroidota bacterium]HET6243310.1 aminomethyl-transferring glycine dehydrogenase [Bacteroidia bacterium]
MTTDNFVSRHNGPREKEISFMLDRIGVSSLDELIEQTIPGSIRLKKPLNLPNALSEFQYSKHIKQIAAKNKLYKTFIGLGYNGCITPPVIQRNILENPGWYTAYTPYQAEISQGRLEALLNFQTMVTDLTGMEMANASLLDEATAAAEAMTMFYNTRSREALKNDAHVFFVSDSCFPQTIDVLKTRALPLGIELIIGNHTDLDFENLPLERKNKIFGALLQYPDAEGKINDYKKFTDSAHQNGALVAVATDLLSLALLTPPGEWGADAVTGNSQRFGVPLGYGGPHAAFFATREDFKRHLPGRIIGVSVDMQGNTALRMALQTREQHIKRDKATSNICTAQALLAIMASMFAVYHGPEGIKKIAEKAHAAAVLLSTKLEELGFIVENKQFFDTIKVGLPDTVNANTIEEIALKNEINFNYIDTSNIGISLDQTTDIEEINLILEVFSSALNTEFIPVTTEDLVLVKTTLDKSFCRTSKYLSHPVFSSFHSETEMMRYIKRLENKDLSLTHSMIPLGSCTMKLNAAAELYPITIPEFAGLHPFVPVDQARGYAQVLEDLEIALCEITGFAAMSFQPNSGAQGEYAGLMVIREYHKSRGDTHRDVSLIPSSAHGTNPASAIMAGMKVVVVKCDEYGNIDINDLRQKAEQYKDTLSCLMVTYPSTHGVYEEGIIAITNIIHENGGQVYMDGANMNAQVGLTSPGNIGADVCHLNLHKTFAIPHGGGGPGMGPIGVATHLVPFLPAHKIIKTGGKSGITAVSAAPFGSSLILLISYGYIKMLGGQGATEATKVAILNANYIKERLKDDYSILYVGKSGRVAHEMILDCKEYKKNAGVEVSDIAKRLMDYGFHAPTVAFPVVDTLMVEPTESESLSELDRFCDTMISIKGEIQEIASGKADMKDNVLKNAPHTSTVVINDNWNHSYSREKAVYPLHWLRNSKFWPSVSRIDNAFGDRNLICSCPAIETYAEPVI